MYMKKVYLFLIFLSCFIVTFMIIKSIPTYGYGTNSSLEYTTSLNNSTDEVNSFDIYDYYNDYVITNKKANIYINELNNFRKIGEISKNVELELSDINNNYFKIKNLDDDYYIYYEDVDKIDYLSVKDVRYKNYILFNKNIVTTDSTNFYDKNHQLYLTIDKSYEFPVIVKDVDYYGIVFNNQILYIKKDEVTLKDNYNTDSTNIKGVSVLNYHFVYKDSDNNCNESICISESFFKKHLDYIKKENFFTPTMRELEMYIDGMIQLPKSVVITFDDGRYFENVKRILEDYKLNGTFFIISGWNWKINFKEYKSDYLELHSHTDNMHDVGKCPSGQGGAIQCFSEEKILNDLKMSREKLNGTTYLAYPFYEYNNYSISMLKKAGFTMAFGGEYENGYKYVKPGIDKFKLPRWVIVNYTTMNNFINYLNLW